MADEVRCEKSPCCREKYWSEIDPVEKCKRLRDEVKRMKRRMAEMELIVRRLMKHGHDQQGRPSVSIDPDDGPMPDLRHVDGDDVFF